MSPEQTPWVDDERIAREGIALVCPVPEPYCMAKLNARASGVAAATVEVSITRTYFGVTDPAVRYVIAIIPPRR
jgi:hypothetical protein